MKLLLVACLASVALAGDHMLESNRSARCVCDACFDEDREGVAAAMAANGATPDQIAGRVRRAP